MIPHLIFKRILILTIFICILSCKSSQTCELATDQVNQQILNSHPIPCLEKALRNGWQKVIDYLVKQKQTQYQQEFIRLFQQQLKRLEILEEQIVLGTSQTQPILKWGQNKTHVFVTFKLSHRWDSPPCLYTQSQKSHLEEEAFSYNNVCVVSQQKINFKVNLNLNKKVFLSLKDSKIYDKTQEKQQVSQQQESSHENDDVQTRPNIQTNFTQYSFEVKKDGVGQYSTILLKQQPEIWLFLTKQQKIYPIWHEISQRYPQDFNEYEQKVQTFKMLQKQKQSVPTSSIPTSQQSYQPLFKSIAMLSALLILCILFS